jgi:two-component system sensor kinase FixL
LSRLSVGGVGATLEMTFQPEDQAAAVLAAIAQSSEDAIVTLDLDGVVRTWHPAAQRLYGFSADEIVGRSASILLPPDRSDELSTLLARVGQGERIDQHETVRRAKDGRLVDVAVSMTPIRQRDDRVVGAVVIARDLTDRNRADTALRASELRWRSVVDSAVDAIIVIDSKGRVEAFNRGAERLFGYREDEVIGRNVNVLMPAPYHDEHDGYVARYLSSGKPRIIGIGREVTALRRDGTTFPVHLSVGEMAIAGERKFTGILHDLSARVHIEEQLREQTALARLGQMAAVLAHEIKNPLAGVRGAIQVIGARLPKESKDAAVVKEIVTRIDALNELMTDLLLFARPPQPKPMPVDITALVKATADLLGSDPQLAGVQVTIAGSAPALVADGDLLKIVFENLMVNAAQAMRGRGTIDVSVVSQAEACQVVIADDGPGIPSEVREQVFTPFFTTKARGSGLGLPTAKRLVEAHGGTIAIACPPAGGTTVTIVLPVQNTAAV